MSVESIITENLDIWTSAIKTKSASGRGNSSKLELYGIKKLRELILNLAVSGKLVKQDPNEEPATKLVREFSFVKERLVKEKKIKKQKVLPTIEVNDIDIGLPVGWAAKRLGDVSLVITKGTTPTSVGFAFTDHGVNFIKVENVSKGRINTKSINQFISEQTHAALERSALQSNDILFSIAGTIGKTCLVREEDLPANTNQALAIIKGTDQVFVPEFLMILLDSLVAEKTREKARGGAMPNVSLGDLAVLVTLIPPLGEQIRIVKKVAELMALCDQLESQTEASIEAHQTLVKSLLETLINAKDADELNDSWQRISAHFDVLFTTEDSIDQLKQTVLQLAVMGKLVKQDPNDEPASKLLERIAAEKQQLIKDKKIKKQSSLPEINKEEKTIELRKGWTYSRLDDLCTNVCSGSTPPKSELSESGNIPFLKVYNIQNQEIDFSDRTLFISESAHLGKLKRSVLFPGDVVMNLVGPPLGKVAILPDTYPEWNCNQNIVCFRPLKIELNRYIYTYLKAQIFLKHVVLVGSAGQDFLSGTKSRSIVLPLPPLEEQKRIVDKVENLFKICELLRNKILEVQENKRRLATSITSSF